MDKKTKKRKPIETVAINFLGFIVFIGCPIIAHHISNFISKIFDIDYYDKSLLNYFLWVLMYGFCFYGIMLLSENKK